MKEEELEALFRQKRNAEETVGLPEVSHWLNTGLVVVASAGVVATASKWLLTKKLFLMTLGILTAAGAITTVTLFLSAGGKDPVPSDRPGKLLASSPAVVRNIEADLDSVRVKKDTLRKPQNAPVPPIMPFAPLSPLSPLAPMTPMSPVFPVQPINPALQPLPMLPPFIIREHLPDTTVMLEKFDRILTKGMIRLTIKKRDACKMTMGGETAQLVTWKVSGGKLTIEGADAESDKEKELVIYVKELKELRFTGFTTALVADGFPFEDLNLTLDGFSSCSLNSAIRKLTLNMSGSCRAKIKSDVTSAQIDISGLSALDLSGKMGTVNAKLTGMTDMELNGSANLGQFSASGQSMLRALGAEVKEISIDVSGQSHAEVQVSDRLQSSASGMSTVIFSGDPHSISKNISGQSSIEKKG